MGWVRNPYRFGAPNSNVFVLYTPVGSVFAGETVAASVTLTPPTDTAENDLLVAFLTISGPGNFTTPTGWTKAVEEVSSTIRTYIFYILRGSTAPTYQFDIDVAGFNRITGLIARYRKAGTTSVTLLGTSGRFTTAGTTLTYTAPSTTVGAAGAIIIGLLATTHGDGRDVDIEGDMSVANLSASAPPTIQPNTGIELPTDRFSGAFYVWNLNFRYDLAYDRYVVPEIASTGEWSVTVPANQTAGSFATAAFLLT